MPTILPSKVVPALPRAARHAGDDYGATAQPDWRSIDWPAHLHWAEVEGRALNYLDIGPRDSEQLPTVFIHGLGGIWQNWLENIPRAATDRRVIAMDLPGFGHSEMPREKHSISLMARVVEGLLDQVGLTSVAVVGNSMGGFVAAELAINYPQRVDRLVLASAAGISSNDVRRRPASSIMKMGAILSANTVASHRLVARRAHLRHVALSIVARHPSRLKADLAYEGLLQGVGTPGFADAVDANLEYDFRDSLPEIGCPTLIIWGEKDPIIPVRDAKEYNEAIPDSRMVILEDTGHIPMAERPETFNELMMDFLDERGEADENVSEAASAGDAETASA
ncbi:MAG: alpha/beta fold hydrolase [Thermoleophilaceae bacterium]|nr:alpha/beta fold hydrolase [Thermoleophilaceae bacterium]